jgi:phospholipase/carboxylesterase
MSRVAIVRLAVVAVLAALLLAAPSRADDARLETVEIVTGGADPADALPIVVAVHGLGGTPRHFAHVFDGFPERARIVLPRAPERRSVGFSWFPLPWDGVDQATFSAGVARSRDLVAALLERLGREHPGVGRPILTGFSQGGILAFAVGVARPELAVRVVPIAGWLPPTLVPDAKPRLPLVPIRALHGEDDDLLPIGRTQRLVATLSRDGFDATLHAFAHVGHAIQPPVRDALYAELAAGIEAARAESAARMRLPTSRIVPSGTRSPIAVTVIMSGPSSP